MISLLRTNSQNNDFLQLVDILDSILEGEDGDDYDYFRQFNSLEKIQHVVVAYQNKVAVGCGAFRHFTDDTCEIKRVVTHPDFRYIIIYFIYFFFIFFISFGFIFIFFN